MKLKSIIKGFYRSHENASKNLEWLRYQVGDLRANSQVNDIKNAEFKVFSQWGEDGIIQYLIHNIQLSNPVFVEFGVEDYTESNTRFLLMHDNWEGLVIDGGADNIDKIKRSELYWRYRVNAIQAFITAENINDLINQNGVSGDIGSLSVDIDGNDYWVWKAIDCIHPDIVICEYNYRFGKEKAVTVPYNPNFVRGEAHYSMVYYGASIAALVKLGNKKGYKLVAGNSNGNNLFFVLESKLNDKVTEISIDDAYRVGSFRESRDPSGKLIFLPPFEEKRLLEKLPIEEV